MGHPDLEKKVVFVRKISLKDTLGQLAVGETVFIRFTDTSPNSIRTSARKLLPKKFHITEKGQVDKTKITRLS